MVFRDAIQWGSGFGESHHLFAIVESRVDILSELRQSLTEQTTTSISVVCNASTSANHESRRLSYYMISRDDQIAPRCEEMVLTY